MNVTAEKVKGDMEAQVPMQRIGDPEEYANLVCFLASHTSKLYHRNKYTNRWWLIEILLARGENEKSGAHYR